jgi:uncharacterized protein
MAQQTLAAPTAPAERIQIVDILRGFALLGILVVNMELFSHPVQTVLLPYAGSGFADRAAAFMIRFLAEGKFYSLFSFLFGLGFYLLMERLEQKKLQMKRIYVRRLLALLIFGVTHALLLWVGDILALYAVTGLTLLLFRRAKPRTLLTWAVILVLLMPLFYAGSLGLLELGRAAGPETAAEIDASLQTSVEGARADAERGMEGYLQRSYFAVTAQRWYDWSSFMVIGNLSLLPGVLAMFLVGLYFGKRRLLAEAEANRPFFRRLLVWGLVIGLPGNFLFASLGLDAARSVPTLPLLIGSLGQALGAPMLALAYVAALVLLSQSRAVGPWLARLAPVGRMALSNYLTQSVVCSTLFYGYGLGLFGKVGTALGLVVTLAVYLPLIPLSAWWLGRFRFGPMEWLWRTITYWSKQKMS